MISKACVLVFWTSILLACYAVLTVKYLVLQQSTVLPYAGHENLSFTPCEQRKPPCDKTHNLSSTSKGHHNINGSFQDQTHPWPRLSLSPMKQSKHHPITPNQNTLAQLPIYTYPLYPTAHHCLHALHPTIGQLSQPFFHFHLWLHPLHSTANLLYTKE